VVFSFLEQFTYLDQLERVMTDVHRVERWLALAALVGLAAWLTVLAWRRGRMGAKRDAGSML
jgi:hypothetical protein